MTADILDSLDDLTDELELEDETDEIDDIDLIEDDDLAFEMSEGKAREVTDAIRAAASATYVLLAEAHAGKAHKALGYATWADYVGKEFEISSARSYQLLDLSKVISVIEDAAPEGTVVKLTEAQARDIKRELPKITERIIEETEGQDPDEARSTVDRIVEETREQKRLDDAAVAKKEADFQEARDEGYRAGLESAADALLEADAAGTMSSSADDSFLEVEVEGDGAAALSPQDRMDIYNFFNVLEGVTSLPEPDDFVKLIPEGRQEEVENQLNSAAAWINRFATLWEMRDEG